MALSDVVAGNIKLVRMRRKLTQEELARKAHISVSYVSMMERGVRTPPLDTVEVIAGVLGIAPFQLCRG